MGSQRVSIIAIIIKKRTRTFGVQQDAITLS
jgi:hypothetical protein